MSDDILDRTLHEGLRARLDAAAVPPADLAAVSSRGRQVRRRRRATAAVGAAALAAVVAGTAVPLLDGGGTDRRVVEFAPAGPLDFSEGLRAYAAPGAEIHLGGRTFDAADMEHLDTDAAATPYGVVFFSGGLPHLLAEDGTTTPLEDASSEGSPEPRGAAMDAHNPWVAYAYTDGAAVSVVVRDLSSGREVDRRIVDCAGADCGTRVDAMDVGKVFLRDEDGTAVWDVATGSLERFAGPGTRVADARGGVVLYDGERPDGPATQGWRLVPGAVDAQLTFDGEHVLYWSSTLAPTRPGGRPVRLEEGSPDMGLGWWAVDTDGSVLTAVPGRGNRSTVHDCVVPSGTCEELGPLTTEHGDPVFIGNDM